MVPLRSCSANGVGKALFEAGFLDVYADVMRRYNPIERIGKQDLIPCMVLGASKDVMEQSQIQGVDVVPALIRAGVVEITVSSLAAYQMLGRPGDVAVNALQWGGLFVLEVLLSNAESAPMVAAKLRSAGVDVFRYVLDNPLVMLADFGWETGVHATKVAAQVHPLLLSCVCVCACVWCVCFLRAVCLHGGGVLERREQRVVEGQTLPTRRSGPC